MIEVLVMTPMLDAIHELRNEVMKQTAREGLAEITLSESAWFQVLGEWGERLPGAPSDFAFDFYGVRIQMDPEDAKRLTNNLLQGKTIHVFQSHGPDPEAYGFKDLTIIPPKES